MLNEEEEADSAVALASFVAISTSLGLGFLSHVPRAAERVDIIVATIALLLLLVFSMAFFLLALETRTVRDLISTTRIITYTKSIDNKHDRERLVTKQLVLQVSLADDDLRDKIEVKARKIERGVLCLKSFLVLGLAFVFELLATL